MKSYRPPLRSALVREVLQQPSPVVVGETLDDAVLNDVVELPPALARRRDRVHERSFSPERVPSHGGSRRDLFLHRGAGLPPDSADAVWAAPESIRDDARADQCGIGLAMQLRQLSLAQCGERRRQIPESAAQVIEIACRCASASHQVRQPVAQSHRRCRQGVDAFSNLPRRPLETADGAPRFFGPLHQREKLLRSEEARKQVGGYTVDDSIGPTRGALQHVPRDVVNVATAIARYQRADGDYAEVRRCSRVERDRSSQIGAVLDRRLPDHLDEQFPDLVVRGSVPTVTDHWCEVGVRQPADLRDGYVQPPPAPTPVRGNDFAHDPRSGSHVERLRVAQREQCFRLSLHQRVANGVVPESEPRCNRAHRGKHHVDAVARREQQAAERLGRHAVPAQ